MAVAVATAVAGDAVVIAAENVGVGHRGEEEEEEGMVGGRPRSRRAAGDSFWSPKFLKRRKSS